MLFRGSLLRIDVLHLLFNRWGLNLKVKFEETQVFINPIYFFSVKVISLTDDLKLSIKDHEMTEEYNKVVASFQNDLCQRLCLRLTPEILYSIPVSLIDANKKLLSLFLPVFFLLKIFRFPTNAYSWAM